MQHPRPFGADQRKPLDAIGDRRLQVVGRAAKIFPSDDSIAEMPTATEMRPKKRAGVSVAKDETVNAAQEVESVDVDADQTDDEQLLNDDDPPRVHDVAAIDEAPSNANPPPIVSPDEKRLLLDKLQATIQQLQQKANGDRGVDAVQDTLAAA